jgi:hypothetical protein
VLSPVSSRLESLETWTTPVVFAHGIFFLSFFLDLFTNDNRRWLFIIEGAITIVVAMISALILPNFPRTTSWLSEEEKELAAWRLEEDIGEDDWVDSEQQSFLHGVKLALADIKTWILVSLPPTHTLSTTNTNYIKR